MISVIVPTMWYDLNFCSILAKIVELPIIGEVIIINNNVDETPNDSVLNHQKVKMHNMQKNIYVNPAWNLGAELAINDVLAFLGDDVDFDMRIFQKTYDLIKSKSDIIGTVCVLSPYFNHEGIYKKFYTDGSIDFCWSSDPDESRRPPPIGMGNLFFVQKKDWVKIPEQTKIFHGEILLWNYYNETKQNYIAVNCYIKTEWHTTWRKLSHQSTESDATFHAIQMSDQKFCEDINYDIRNLPEYSQ